ncbi:tRNA1(Val) (adenine(37)-N6)-methyltransferase [Algivirga pacifica]|uniref:tRNA1(Val) (adenine(37)-N6)-methyltransferase n=1 Tax=Algivirga pacifica TaxID=1162670 RepID=A0ABP9DL76_9BACT
MGKVFKFKEFGISQDRCAMKIGTDGIVLGAWVLCGLERRILDVGTGTGLLSLMIAQRNPKAYLSALEIDTQAAEQAMENIAQSPFSDRIEVIPQALQQFEPIYLFDLIVSNPPFFSNSLKGPQEERNLARHTDTLPFEDLLAFAERFLTAEGRLCVILPVSEMPRLEEDMKQYSFYFQRICWIKHTEQHTVRRVILDLGRKQRVPEEEVLCLREEDGVSYSAAYKALTKDFHPFF